MADEAPEAPVDDPIIDDTEQDDTPEPVAEPDWKSEARKHERRAKQTARELSSLQSRLKEREDADKTEQEKAIEQAREQARAEALSEADKERRNDRLELAVTRLASRGFGDGDRFADPDDALVYLERAIARGDVDPEDIFDDGGKVQTDAVQTALQELLENKPHLRAQTDGAQRVPGSSDAGKGRAKSGEDESVDDILARKRRHTPR